MNQWHRVIVLVFCIGILPVSDVAALAGDTPSGSDQVKQQIDQFGVGANLKVQLADGKKLLGSIEAIEDGSFLIASGHEGTQRRVAYDEVAQLKLAKLMYKAAGQPNPAEARRVVLGLGVGKHIMVKTAAGKEYHGNIQAIDQDYFTMLRDHQAAPVQIAYNDVRQMGPNLSTGAKIGIIAGVAGLVIFIAFWQWLEHAD